MEVIEVDDAADPRLDDFRGLMDADVRPDRRGIVIAEGVNVVTRLARSAYPMRAIIGVRKKLEALGPELLDRDVPAYQCDKWLLSDVVGFRVTRGVLAAASRPPAPIPTGCCRPPDASRCWKGSTTSRTSARCSATPPRSGSTPCCSTARALIRSTGAASGCRWGTCCGCRSPCCPGPWADELDRIKRHGLRLLAMTPHEDASDLRALPAPAPLGGPARRRGPGTDRSEPGRRRPARPHPDGR